MVLLGTKRVEHCISWSSQEHGTRATAYEKRKPARESCMQQLLNKLCVSQHWKSQIRRVDTLPFVCRVWGSVLYKTLSKNLLELDVLVKQCDAIITKGVQTA